MSSKSNIGVRHSPETKAQALQLLLEGELPVAVSKETGVTPTTLRTWATEAGITITYERGGRPSGSPDARTYAERANRVRTTAEALRRAQEHLKGAEAAHEAAKRAVYDATEAHSKARGAFDGLLPSIDSSVSTYVGAAARARDEVDCG